MMAEKPIIHAYGGAHDPVSAAGAGICVAPYAAAELDSALRRMAAMSPDERAAMGARGRDYVLREHDWSELGRRYLDLCRGLASKTQRRPEEVA